MPAWLPPLEIDGLDCLLVLPEINWRRRPRLTAALAIDEAEGRTGIAARASDHHELRLALDYLYTLSAEAATQLHAALLALDPETRLALPLWPDKLPAADYLAERVWASQHWINLDTATGAYALDEEDGHPESVGLAICSLLERPKFTPKLRGLAEVVLRAEEDSPWESRVEIHALEQLVWNFEADWSTLPDDTSRWQLNRRRLGHGRLTARTGLEGATKRGQAASYTFRGRAELRRALTFWAGKRGPHGAFTVPLEYRPGWDGAPESVPSMQAHFAEETFALEYSTPEVARSRLAFTQDLLLAEGEPGQPRPSRAFLYKVWWEGSATVMAWTDWATAYTHAGIDYLPRIVEHKGSVETLRPGQSEWELLVYDFEGNPLRAFGRLARERRLNLEIRECDPAVADTAALVFSGEIKAAPSKGPIFTAKAALFGDALRFLVPQYYCQQGCNNVLGDELCGIDIEALKVAGTIAALDGVVVDITCASAAAADTYALGFAEFGAGDDLELRFVLRSAPIAGGQRLTVHRPLWSSAVAAAVALYPGCDQQYYGGCARYANQARFFGAPHKPDYIESVDSGVKSKVGK
ncbi:MAG: phage BR0599 family protein [Verrucomicrobia bacterium]|nr:phage BR0599 family protein [Verrucomicrobiota bacterium]